MEPDLQIVVKGISDELGQKVGVAVASVVKVLGGGEHPLDFRRMHRIIAAADFGAELAQLSSATASGRAIEHTNEEYALAVAKVLLLPRDEGIEILPVFNANALIPLTENSESDAFRYILHLLHHELCHVHDDNKKLDALADVILKHHYRGKDIFIGPLAETCWSEYAANRLSSGSATDSAVSGMATSLKDALQRTKTQIDREILHYRRHADLDGLLALFQRHGEFLARAAAYVLGYMDGLEAPLGKLAPETAEVLSDSYFEETWKTMQAALRQMWDIYPAGWHDLSVYGGLAQVLEDYYASMGLILSTTEDGRAYVHIPFRPETTPGIGI